MSKTLLFALSKHLQETLFEADDLARIRRLTEVLDVPVPQAADARRPVGSSWSTTRPAV
jgi:hypothetical protein